MTNWKVARCLRRYVLPRKQSALNATLQKPNIRYPSEFGTGNVLRVVTRLTFGQIPRVVENAHARREFTHVTDRPYITKANKCVVIPVRLSVA